MAEQYHQTRIPEASEGGTKPHNPMNLMHPKTSADLAASGGGTGELTSQTSWTVGYATNRDQHESHS